MVGDALTIFTAVERLRGYREALTDGGIAVDESLVRTGSHDVESAERAARELLSLDRPPTALFTGNNRITTGALRAIAAHDRPVALVGFDDFELADLLALPVTVVAYDPAELGRQAAQLLCRRLAGDNGKPKRIVLPTSLVPRGSGEVRAEARAA
jgi:LacI family transcriptional regulator